MSKKVNHDEDDIDDITMMTEFFQTGLALVSHHQKNISQV